MSLRDLQKYEEMKQELADLQKEKGEYIAENRRSSDGDGDGVEFEENDEYCIELNKKIKQLENDISLMEDYLREHGE